MKTRVADHTQGHYSDISVTLPNALTEAEGFYLAQAQLFVPHHYFLLGSELAENILRRTISYRTEERL
jgi:hypothetical protein